MKHALTVLIAFALATSASIAEMRHVGDFMLVSRSKLTGEKHQPMPIKPMVFHVSTDGVHVQVKLDDNEEANIFHVYASEGIGRLNKDSNTLEIVPGIQASSNKGGVLRHLRLTTDEMTITTFPARSDQAVVIHAVATDKNKPVAQTSNPPNEP
jgi:hypothetical protein